MFWPISLEFPLMWWYSIDFDMRWGWLQRSGPVKPSSSVTLMTFPRGCHESVRCWPALPHSMCVKRCGLCWYLFVMICGESCWIKNVAKVWSNGQHVSLFTFVDAEQQDTDLSILTRWIVSIKVMFRTGPAATGTSLVLILLLNRSTGAARHIRQTCNLATSSWRSTGKTLQTCWTWRPRTRSRTPRLSCSWWWRGTLPCR